MADSFDQDLSKAITSNKEFRAEVRKILKENFDEKKQVFLSNFDNHPVTQEVGNPESANISNTLGGYGNLYGFLGFFEGTDPVGPVRKLIDRVTRFRGVQFRGENAFLKYDVPELDDFDSVAALEWDTKNWVKGIERGLSGFQSFMAQAGGRSGKGFQIKSKVTPFTGAINRFQNTKYMSRLINDFKASLKKYES